jgi:hypothetical protein
MKLSAVHRIGILAAAIYMLSGCTLSAADLVPPQSCNASTSFTRGMNDGMAGGPMDSNYIQFCPENTQNAMQQGYRDGYIRGREMKRQDEQISTMPTSSDVNINIGNDRPGRGNWRPANTGRNYFCKIKAFGTEHSAFGRTELETRQAVRAKCEADNGSDSMFCRNENIDCQKNK